MARFKLTIEYDGTGLAGWQRQKTDPSVQTHLETAIEKLTGTKTDVIGAGRTDAGVHATGQVAHVDIEKPMSPFNVMHGTNYHLTLLNPQIIVRKAEEVDSEFHARFHATKRYYVYRIINRQARLTLDVNRAWHIPEKLDVSLMQSAAKHLLGHHDFTTFRSTQCQSKTPMKTLETLDIVQNGETIDVFVSARSFLHHQVRNMVGTLRLIGNNKWRESDLLQALHACDRTQGGETAPPQGLCLTHVTYD